jgi:tRNA pseudouridine-54 N-methylase
VMIAAVVVVDVVVAEVVVVVAEEIQTVEAQRARNLVGQRLRVDILVAAFLLLLAETLAHPVVAVETVLLAVESPVAVVHLVAEIVAVVHLVAETVAAFLAESQEKVEEESPFDRLDDERPPFVQGLAW